MERRREADDEDEDEDAGSTVHLDSKLENSILSFERLWPYTAAGEYTLNHLFFGFAIQTPHEFWLRTQIATLRIIANTLLCNARSNCDSSSNPASKVAPVGNYIKMADGSFQRQDDVESEAKGEAKGEETDAEEDEEEDGGDEGGDGDGDSEGEGEGSGKMTLPEVKNYTWMEIDEGPYNVNHEWVAEGKTRSEICKLAAEQRAKRLERRVKQIEVDDAFLLQGRFTTAKEGWIRLNFNKDTVNIGNKELGNMSKLAESCAGLANAQFGDDHKEAMITNIKKLIQSKIIKFVECSDSTGRKDVWVLRKALHALRYDMILETLVETLEPSITTPLIINYPKMKPFKTASGSQTGADWKQQLVVLLPLPKGPPTTPASTSTSPPPPPAPTHSRRSSASLFHNKVIVETEKNNEPAPSNFEDDAQVAKFIRKDWFKYNIGRFGMTPASVKDGWGFTRSGSTCE